MSRVTLVLCIHNHQPVGNLPNVFEHAYRSAYLPFLEAVEQFPDIKIVLHNTGPLLEWYEEHAPDYIERVAALVARGQVEVLGGAFYEPILSMIPERDAHGQIGMMSDYVSDRFGVRPRGMWLAERVWEPRLAKTIREAGIEYLPLDDYEFRLAGIEDEDLVGPFLLEEQGVAVSAYPISKRLRYAIPFAEPDETLSVLGSIAGRGDGHVAVFGDDGEKFGVWPGTHAHVHSGGWLNRFFRTLSENSEWVRTATFSEVADSARPRGRAYLPTSSYPEMMEWALPTKARRDYEQFLKKLGDDGVLEQWGPFVSGGTWKGFLSKYGESNLMVRKMMRVSDKVAGARRASGIGNMPDGPADVAAAALAPDVVGPATLEEATRELWRGQCNCAYWHGIFGGLYLPHLRTAIYDSLIRAERLLECGQHVAWDRAEVRDHDLDGRDEVLLETHRTNVYVSPSRGGTIFELDARQADWNVLATMARHDEAYHDGLTAGCDTACEDEVRNIHDGLVVKEKGLERLVGVDAPPAVSAIDHFYAPGVKRGDVEGGAADLGDFAWADYEFELSRSEGAVGVWMGRTGRVATGAGDCPVTLEKRVWVESSGVVRLEVDLVPDGELNAVFASEWNLSFLTPDKDWVCLYAEGSEPTGLRKRRALENVERLYIEDRLRGHRLDASFGPGSGVWTWPLDTASHSEGGLERVFQGLTLVAHWPMKASRGERLSFHVELGFSPLDDTHGG